VTLTVTKSRFGLRGAKLELESEVIAVGSTTERLLRLRENGTAADRRQSPPKPSALDLVLAVLRNAGEVGLRSTEWQRQTGLADGPYNRARRELLKTRIVTQVGKRYVASRVPPAS
jgi:hypothetical protein